MRCSRSSSGGKPTSISRSSAPFSIARFSDKPLIAQYFRTIADVAGLVNLAECGVVGQFEHGQKNPNGILETIRCHFYNEVSNEILGRFADASRAAIHA